MTHMTEQQFAPAVAAPPQEAPAAAPVAPPAQPPAAAPVNGGNPSADSWVAPPPPPPSWDTKSQIGATCLVAVHKHETGVLTQHGVKSCVHVTIVELAGPNPGIIFEDVTLYNVQLVGQLEGLVGRYTLGRFALGQGKGAQPPMVLNPPTGTDTTLAQQWFDANPGKMAELQAAGKLAADQPKPPPQMQNQWQQPGPMQGNQWQNSPTQGYGQPPQGQPQWGQQGGYGQQAPAQNQWGQQQPQAPEPYPWNGGQQAPAAQSQQAQWQQPAPAAGGWQSPPPVTAGQGDAPPF